MLLNILQYDVKIIHKKGKEMYLADTLSRSFLPIKNTHSKNESIDEFPVISRLGGQKSVDYSVFMTD